MENSISYCAGGKKFKFVTQLKFGELSNEQIAVKVFLSVSFDRDSRLLKGEIPISLSEEETQHMTDADLLEWKLTTNIEFVDYISKKRFFMHLMSDFLGNFKVEPLD